MILFSHVLTRTSELITEVEVHLYFNFMKQINLHMSCNTIFYTSVLTSNCCWF